ncbi:TPA: hypothetical protein RQN76_004320 [Aeromonas dhakensis]|nr:hypothetical protein [Aeromonas dhakensis]
MSFWEYIKEKRAFVIFAVLIISFAMFFSKPEKSEAPVQNEIKDVNYISAIFIKKNIEPRTLISNEDIEIKEVDSSTAEKNTFLTVADFESSTRVSSKHLTTGTAVKKGDLYKYDDVGYLDFIYSPKNMTPFIMRFNDPDREKSRGQLLDQINYDVAKNLVRGDKVNIYANETVGRNTSSRVIIYNADVADISFEGKKAKLVLGIQKEEVKNIFENMSKDIYIAKCIDKQNCEMKVDSVLSTNKIVEVRG